MNKNILTSMVGKTPLVRATGLEKALGISEIYLKLEGNNPSGQRIDRLAYLLLKDAVSKGKETICIGSHLPLARSLALISSQFNINCVFIFPENIKASTDKVFRKDNIKIIEYGRTVMDSSHYSSKLCEKNDWFNGNLGIENNILNMTAIASIAEEIYTQLNCEIDSVFSLLSYGFSVSGLDLGFRQLWVDNKISQLPQLYSCTTSINNPLYEAYQHNDKKITLQSKGKTKTIVTKYNKHLLNFNEITAQDALNSIYAVNGKLTGVEGKELIKNLRKFLEVENIKFSIENGYAIAGFMKEVDKRNIKNGTHVILLNDGRIDVEVRRIERHETELSIDEIANYIQHWLMEFSDPIYEIKEALEKAFCNGYVLMAYYNNQLVGISVIVNTGFNSFIPSYHLGYIGTRRSIKGRGIATQLLNKAVELTKGNLSLHVDRNNSRAIKLYEKMGFAKSYLRMIHKTR
ncbi:pyridoxal-phosphate dependent enzyme [Alkaliphilus transvaalensis]|uniref:pyridoxal-phosphate dependent enzyme n=1 Tax=Alkaliphilus transvaalensis TaxID=114628 RepID=UPI00047CC03C|nr:pyridoxal-phosphate dependent enzyme [Alkaliphilus transvaalensis]